MMGGIISENAICANHTMDSEHASSAEKVEKVSNKGDSAVDQTMLKGRQSRDMATQTPVDAATQTEDKSDEKSKDKKADGKEKSKEGLELTGIGRSYEKDGGKKVIDEAEWEGLPPPETDDSKFAIVVARSKTREQVTIRSKYLQNLFRRKLPHTYGISFDGETVSFAEPYTPLYFNLDTLAKVVENDTSPEAQPKDFEILQRFYNKWVKPSHDEVRLASKDSNVRFENLWALFEPGKLLYAKDHFDQPQLYVIGASTFRGRAFDGKVFEETMLHDDHVDNIMTLLYARPKHQGRFCVDVWGVSWDGSTRLFSRAKKTLTLHQFAGTRSITSFDFYPLEHYANGSEEARNALLEKLEHRGYMWKQYVSDTPCVRHHMGAARKIEQTIKTREVKSEKKFTNLDERVIVDHDGPLSSSLEGQVFDSFSSWFSESYDSERAVQYSVMGYGHIDFDAHPPERDFAPFQAQLCPSIVNCAALSNQKWYEVTVNSLTEVKWARESFERLVLDPKQKELIQSLVEQHRKNRGRIMSDLIIGKGKGLVVVLHGPPGVGKTLTAESVAEYTQKPLFPINVSELTTEDSVVASLQNAFEKASRWDAVLLLDEADVVLEQRSLEDVKRNGIVSVFLRMLEYYQGILFLTTNRLGTMDSAFISRIHIAVRFKVLDTAKRRAIWRNFIDRLDDNECEAKDELYEHLDDLAGWELNGREIRNVLTVAQSLAMGQRRSRGALRFIHVERVATQVLDFQEYVENAGRENRIKLNEIADRAWPGPTRTSTGYSSILRR